MSNETRKLPTRAGWWCAQYDGGDDPICILVESVEEGTIMFAAVSSSAFKPHGFLRWLAPIPGPAVCAALARRAKALTALDDLGASREVADEFVEAGDALDDAIRAERDGDA